MSKIKIIGAAYGAVEGSYDVTARVQQHVDHVADTLKADNDHFGDPANGHTKHFGCIYEIDGKINSRACEEGQTVQFD
jgi:hypothetical protein